MIESHHKISVNHPELYMEISEKSVSCAAIFDRILEHMPHIVMYFRDHDGDNFVVVCILHKKSP